MEKFVASCAGNQLPFAPKTISGLSMLLLRLSIVQTTTTTTTTTPVRRLLPAPVVTPHRSFQTEPTNQMLPFTPFIRPRHPCNRIKRPKNQSSWVDRIIGIRLKEYPQLRMKDITFKPRRRVLLLLLLLLLILPLTRPKLFRTPPICSNDRPRYQPTRRRRRQVLIFNRWMEKRTVWVIWMTCRWTLIHFDCVTTTNNNNNNSYNNSPLLRITIDHHVLLKAVIHPLWRIKSDRTKLPVQQQQQGQEEEENH